ncbi:unnamed protein product [Clonostachys byssicola]|uniref:Uncharacterized protein n=1 Tax=Clonostachys byssicola TaxID=160290 RepID=A0A9N9U0I2_9HYPO|nr:unnamed protein product [Clonostachys byssicola]
MNHLFLVPEIVAVIVKSGSLYKGYLYTCLLVNRAFFQESARLLWYACGGGVWKPSEVGHALADVEHLASVSRKDPQRAQMYANFIRVLQFNEWLDGSEYRGEFEWHHELLSLQFPQLKTVRFIEDGSATRLITGHALLHYAQPNVVEFYVATGSQLSDAFLDTLFSKYNTVTREGLVRFLQRSRQLRVLRIQNVFDDLWSEDVFRIIEQLPDLYAVGLPLIEESWLKEITGFQALTSLHTNISNQGLELLAASLPYLLEVDLHFESLRPSLSVMASFTRLRSLELRFPLGSSFDAQHLLLIARCCLNLKFVAIAERGHRPRASGLNDEFIEQLAHHIPHFWSLCLKIETNEEPMTFRSVQSLCRLCPELVDIILGPITIDWSEIKADAGGGGGQMVMSKDLWGLHFVLHQDQQPLPFNEALEEENRAQSESILQLTRNVASVFPSLSAFSLEGEGKREGERQLWLEVTEYCEGR